MSGGGRYNYLHSRHWHEGMRPEDENLHKMAQRLDDTPGADKAAADTWAVIEALREAHRLAEDLSAVWEAVEWVDSGDWGEHEVHDEVAKYRARHRKEGEPS